MRNLKGFVPVLVAVLTIGGLLAAAAGPLWAGDAKPRYGGVLRLTEVTDGASLGYPAKQTPVYSQRQCAPVVESLFRTDKTGNAVPFLATGFKNDVKNRALTLSLRKGIKFHDGTDFNAEAVKWNLEQYMAAKLGGTEKFKSIDVVDDYTVRINMTDWDNTATTNFAYTLGMVVSPTACKKNGEEWAAKNPVGTGPFQFVNTLFCTRPDFAVSKATVHDHGFYQNTIWWTPEDAWLER